LSRILYWEFVALRWKFIPYRKTAVTNKRYSIGVVTYINRYEKVFKPFIQSICKLFPDTEVIVAINGYYDAEKQDKYLAEINEFLSQFANVTKFDYKTGQSLSKLWNQLIIHSSNDAILIFNDDVKIDTSFRRNIEECSVLDEKVALLNRSWSHFLITKKMVAKNGWFDERFPGVGNEDEDYESRLVLNGIHVKTFSASGLKNIVFTTKDFSYGKNTETVNTKYVKANKQFFDSKWEWSEIEKTGFAFVPLVRGYVRMKEGMQTPDFYPEINYNAAVNERER
jgi:GR25 family glycosyltransferase involved in LPS biosynthesis